MQTEVTEIIRNRISDHSGWYGMGGRIPSGGWRFRMPAVWALIGAACCSG